MCRDLDPGERLAMRADLLEIPLREPICEQCLRAWSVNVGFGWLNYFQSGSTIVNNEAPAAIAAAIAAHKV